MRDAVFISSAVAALGFNIAGKCTQIGFTAARSCISAPGTILDSSRGSPDSPMSQLIRSAHTTVGAAEAMSLAAILLARTATSVSLAIADKTLELTGADGSEGGVVNRSLAALAPSRFRHYSPVLQAICDMILKFLSPMQSLSTQKLREALVAFAVLQQSLRLPLHVCTPALSDHDETGCLAAPLQAHDVLRCMGFAAAAYGSLAVNFLEFIPQGTFSSDVFPLLVPGVTQGDVLLRNEDVSLFSSGFVLVSDHSRRTIVLAIRGSMHFNDIITDLTCAAVDCANIFSATSKRNMVALAAHEGCEEVPRVHEGFFLAANELVTLLQEAVREALESCGGTGADGSGEPYQLLLCGHSLGAGVASVLAVIWESVFPGLRCVALAPPCVFTLQAARSTRHLITAVVIGDDMVSRLSLGSAYDLRDACLHLLNEDASVLQCQGGVNSGVKNSSRLYQYILELKSRDNNVMHRQGDNDAVCCYNEENVLRSPLCNSWQSCGDDCCERAHPKLGASRSSVEPSRSDTKSNQVEGVEGTGKALQEMHQVLATLRGCCMVSSEKLFPPGTLIHIVDRAQWEDALVSCVLAPTLPVTERNPLGAHNPLWSAHASCGREYSCPARGCKVIAISDSADHVAYLADQRTFAELQLSGSMFSDHMPQRYTHILREMFPMTL